MSYQTIYAPFVPKLLLEIFEKFLYLLREVFFFFFFVAVATPFYIGCDFTRCELLQHILNWDVFIRK